MPSLELVDAIAEELGISAAELFLAGEDEGKANMLTAPADERVAKLLRAWPEADREQLVEILVQLRKVAGPARKRR